jgi:hypothetical protein
LVMEDKVFVEKIYQCDEKHKLKIIFNKNMLTDKPQMFALECEPCLLLLGFLLFTLAMDSGYSEGCQRPGTDGYAAHG